MTVKSAIGSLVSTLLLSIATPQSRNEIDSDSLIDIKIFFCDINLPYLDIAELKQRLAQEARTNRGLEKELQKLESKISLLIHNRTSIQEIDRNLKKQLKKQAALAAKNTVSKEVFTNDKKKMEGYANLFYVLQTEPKYLAKV